MLRAKFPFPFPLLKFKRICVGLGLIHTTGATGAIDFEGKSKVHARARLRIALKTRDHQFGSRG